MYGTQAKITDSIVYAMFENDVKMYGTQAIFISFPISKSLRMM